MATIVIEAMLLLVLLYYVYRVGRRAWQQQRGTPLPSDRRANRVVRDRGTDDLPDAAAGTHQRSSAKPTCPAGCCPARSTRSPTGRK